MRPSQRENNWLLIIMKLFVELIQSLKNKIFKSSKIVSFWHIVENLSYMLIIIQLKQWFLMQILLINHLRKKQMLLMHMITNMVALESTPKMILQMVIWSLIAMEILEMIPSSWIMDSVLGIIRKHKSIYELSIIIKIHYFKPKLNLPIFHGQRKRDSNQEDTGKITEL